MPPDTDQDSPDEMPEEETQERIKYHSDNRYRLMRVIELLEENFDSIQIFATSCDGVNTTSYECGRGNIYSRVGQAEQWVVQIKNNFNG